MGFFSNPLNEIRKNVYPPESQLAEDRSIISLDSDDVDKCVSPAARVLFPDLEVFLFLASEESLFDALPVLWSRRPFQVPSDLEDSPPLW